MIIASLMPFPDLSIPQHLLDFRVVIKAISQYIEFILISSS